MNRVNVVTICAIIIFKPTYRIRTTMSVIIIVQFKFGRAQSRTGAIGHRIFIRWHILIRGASVRDVYDVRTPSYSL